MLYQLKEKEAVTGKHVNLLIVDLSKAYVNISLPKLDFGTDVSLAARR